MNDLLVAALLAAVWWLPTFACIADLQRGKVRPALMWKWLAILCLPVAGWLLYRSKGRAELERDAARR